MTNFGPLTSGEERILRGAAENDAVVVSGIQRRPAERLRARGFVVLKEKHVPSVSVHGRDEITVEITRWGRESRQKWRKR
jgi:hypothetical protein